MPEYIEKMLEDAGILEDAEISSLGFVNSKPVSFSVTLPVKGNKDKIETLIKMGWSKKRTRKYQTIGEPYYRTQYSGYIMKPTLTWYEEWYRNNETTQEKK